MNKWIKEGLINGLQGVVFFLVVCLMWAIIIKLSENIGLSPAWSMLTFFVIAIFTLSIASAKTKYDLDQKFGGDK